MVGGELTMDGLEIRHDPNSNVSEAPLQMKSNCGCLLIDDFGRQRIEPRELLNRWIVPLESRFDFLTLSTGKKIQVPFEQLIIFSTNLEPCDLVDEAFLRRIPYKVHVSNPDTEEYHELFEIYAREFGCAYRPDVVDYLIEHHYKTANRPMRRCHPRDLLNQIRNFCAYNDLPVEMRDDYFDRIVKSYFAVVVNTPAPGSTPGAPQRSAGKKKRERSVTLNLPGEEVTLPPQKLQRERHRTSSEPVAPSAQQSPPPPRPVEKTVPPEVTTLDADRAPDRTVVCQPVVQSKPAGVSPAPVVNGSDQPPRRSKRPLTMSPPARQPEPRPPRSPRPEV
jgi:hypothetical protein